VTGTARSDERTLHIVAAVIVRDDGRFLLVRKHGTTAFMQVGGKIEPDEAPMEALVRECSEEIGLDVVDHAAVRPLGRYAALAANEPGHMVDAHVFAVDLPSRFEPRAQAELEELVWVDPTDPVTTHPIAPLSLDLLAAAR
jgi:8-oxo-dGTP pyrophosphatase MutT (NUDIX family)